MEAKHTPGPWTAFRHHPNRPCKPGYFWKWANVRSGSRIVCTFHSSVSRFPDLENSANALLIAAAPDLLAALVELSDAVEQWGRKVGNHDQPSREEARVAMAQLAACDALVKARGGAA